MSDKLMIEDFDDATEPYELRYSPNDCVKAKPGDVRNCIQGLAILRDPDVEDVRVYLHITYIWFKREKLPTRYKNSAAVTRLAKANDNKALLSKAARKEFLRNKGLSDPLMLLPPQKHLTKEYLRSDEFRKKRDQSEAKNRNKKFRRRYSKPEARSLRSGRGLAHSWGEAPK